MSGSSVVLEVTAGPSSGKVWTLTRLDELTIGRGSVCGVGKLADSAISRCHGVFSMSSSGILLYTDSSSNGTWYVRSGETQPTSTLKHAAQELRLGDMLLMGHTCVTVSSMTTPAKGVTRFLPRATMDDADAVFHHPFTQILARGPPPAAAAKRELSEDELGEVGREILRGL